MVLNTDGNPWVKRIPYELEMPVGAGEAAGDGDSRTTMTASVCAQIWNKGFLVQLRSPQTSRLQQNCSPAPLQGNEIKYRETVFFFLLNKETEIRFVHKAKVTLLLHLTTEIDVFRSLLETFR